MEACRNLRGHNSHSEWIRQVGAMWHTLHIVEYSSQVNRPTRSRPTHKSIPTLAKWRLATPGVPREKAVPEGWEKAISRISATEEELAWKR